MLKFRHWLMLVLTGTFCTLMLLIVWWIFVDGVLYKPVIKFENQMAIETDKKEYRPGETVYGKFTFCKARNVNAVITWALIDTYKKLYDETRRNSTVVGCVKDEYYSIEKIALDTYPATYHFKGEFCYPTNPLHESFHQIFCPTQILQTVDFNIIK